MANEKDGMFYAPQAAVSQKVVEPGEFVFASAFFDHGHIYGMTANLKDAGATLRYIYEPDPVKREPFLALHPEAKVVDSFDEILSDDEVKLVAAAAIPSERGPIGCTVMKAGKDYFTDKCPFTTLEQLAEAKRVVKETGRKYMVCYSERLQSESAGYAGELIRQGVIGDVVHMHIMGPHRLSPEKRPSWFFEKARYGGILTDIASHQFDQFLFYGKARGGTVEHARVDNFAHPEYPELEDFGEACLRLDTGVSCYSRVDWFTPDGLRTWGDGRSFIVGTRGSIEVRKYVDVTRGSGGKIYLVTDREELEIDCNGKYGFPFFGQFILDCLERTEKAMTQEHAFLASELSLKAQALADRNRR